MFIHSWPGTTPSLSSKPFWTTTYVCSDPHTVFAQIIVIVLFVPFFNRDV